MIRWIVFESILSTKRMFTCMNYTDTLDKDMDPADSTIDKKMDLWDACRLIDCNLMYCIGGFYAICIIYQLIYH